MKHTLVLILFLLVSIKAICQDTITVESIQLEKDTILLGEPIALFITYWNNNSEKLMIGKSGCLPSVNIYAVNQEHGDTMQLRIYHERYTAGFFTVYNIDSNQKIVDTLKLWKLLMPNQPGSYKIVASYKRNSQMIKVPSFHKDLDLTILDRKVNTIDTAMMNTNQKAELELESSGFYWCEKAVNYKMNPNTQLMLRIARRNMKNNGESNISCSAINVLDRLHSSKESIDFALVTLRKFRMEIIAILDDPEPTNESDDYKSSQWYVKHLNYTFNSCPIDHSISIIRKNGRTVIEEYLRKNGNTLSLEESELLDRIVKD